MKFAKSLALALIGNVFGETEAETNNSNTNKSGEKRLAYDYKQVFVDNPIGTLKDKVEAYEER